jgi:hypothetical protein
MKGRKSAQAMERLSQKTTLAYNEPDRIIQRPQTVIFHWILVVRFVMGPLSPECLCKY